MRNIPRARKRIREKKISIKKRGDVAPTTSANFKNGQQKAAFVIRDIVETPQFGGELQDLLPNSARAAAFVSGTKWTLARDPECGIRMSPTSPVWFKPIASNVPDMGNMVIYYTFDDTKVTFLSIKEIGGYDA